MHEVDTNPRKKPRQERARATLEAILDAAVQVLLARGYDGTTTIRVAERAGVSVGSLYQYFPNKEALVAALIERHAAALLGSIADALAGADPEDPEAAVRTFIRAGMDAHRLEPALHKILNEQVPRVGRIAEAMNTSRQITAMLARFLERYRASLVVPDVKLAAFVVEAAVESLVHRVVVEKKHLYGTARLENELTALVVGYLFGKGIKRRRALRRD